MPQYALIIPEAEWQALVADVERLKEVVAKLSPAESLTATPPAPDRILKVREAAAYLQLTPEGLRKARRQKRLAGVHINEKEWGFRLSELDRYLSRYNRRPLAGPE
jgi:hypothetical protein